MRSRLRGGKRRRRVVLHRTNEVDVVTAHRRAECPNPKNDLVTGGEGQTVEEEAAEQGCENIGEGKHDVARACHVRAVTFGDGFGKQSVEAHAQRCEGNRHEEGDEDDGSHLGGGVEPPGEKDEEKEANAVEDGCPEDGAAGIAFGEPAPGGNGKEEVDHRRHGANQTELYTGGAQAGGIDAQKVDDRTAQYAKPGDVVVEVAKGGVIFGWNVCLFEETGNARKHGKGL